MKTRPRPPLTLREIWEKPDDYGSDKIFTTLAVSLENTVNELDYVESDLTEETERRVEDISALQARISCSHPMLQDLEDAVLEMMSDTREELSAIAGRITRLEIVENNLEAVEQRLENISKWPIDGHERRLAKLEAKTGLDRGYAGINRNSPVQLDRLEQIEKYPNMLKTGGK